MQQSTLIKAAIVGVGLLRFFFAAISARTGRDLLSSVAIGLPLLIPHAAVCFFGRQLISGSTETPAQSTRQPASHLKRVVAQHIKDLERQGFKPKTGADG